jgi:hypothetical protein
LFGIGRKVFPYRQALHIGAGFLCNRLSLSGRLRFPAQFGIR